MEDFIPNLFEKKKTFIRQIGENKVWFSTTKLLLQQLKKMSKTWPLLVFLNMKIS